MVVNGGQNIGAESQKDTRASGQLERQSPLGGMNRTDGRDREIITNFHGSVG